MGVAIGLGTLEAGAYGALWEEKTLFTDGIVPAVSGVAAAKATNITGWTLGVSGGAVLSVPFTKATEALADEWKKPDPTKPINFADMPY